MKPSARRIRSIELASSSGLASRSFATRAAQCSETVGSWPAGARRLGGGPPFFSHDDTVAGWQPTASAIWPMVQPWRRSATTSMYSSWVNMTGGALQYSGTRASPEPRSSPPTVVDGSQEAERLRSVANFDDHLSRISVIADSSVVTPSLTGELLSASAGADELLEVVQAQAIERAAGLDEKAPDGL